MKLQVVGPACTRMHAALDEALTAGNLHLPPELQAHLAHCPNCAAAAESTGELLHRLHSVAAGLPLTNLPAAVNGVLSQTNPAAVNSVLGQTTPTTDASRKRLGPAWLLGQMAALAGILLMLLCLLMGLAGVLIHLLHMSIQIAWQPMAQALTGSPVASLLLEREMHPLLHWHYLRCLRLLAPAIHEPPHGAPAPAGVLSRFPPTQGLASMDNPSIQSQLPNMALSGLFTLPLRAPISLRTSHVASMRNPSQYKQRNPECTPGGVIS